MGNIPTHLRRFSHNGVCAPLRVGCALPHAPPMHRGLWICTSFTSSPVRCGWAFPNPIRYTAPESRTPNGPSAEKQNAGENHRHAAHPPQYLTLSQKEGREMTTSTLMLLYSITFPHTMSRPLYILFYPTTTPTSILQYRGVNYFFAVMRGGNPPAHARCPIPPGWPGPALPVPCRKISTRRIRVLIIALNVSLAQ